MAPTGARKQKPSMHALIFTLKPRILAAHSIYTKIQRALGVLVPPIICQGADGAGTSATPSALGPTWLATTGPASTSISTGPTVFAR